MGITKRGSVPFTFNVTVLLSALCWLTLAASNAEAAKLVVLGDSISDTGRAYAACGQQSPLSPPYFKGRLSNGPNWVDQLGNTYNLDVANLAFQAAVAAISFHPPEISALDGSPLCGIQNLPQQLQEYLPQVPLDNPATTLYVLWIGSNDVIALIADVPPANVSSFIPQLVGAIVGACAQLAAAGARNIVWVNVPPVQISPLIDRLGVPPAAKAGIATLVQTINGAVTQALATNLPFVKVLDVYSASLAAYASPPFGITDVTHACLTNYQKLGRDPNVIVCDSPATHLFWDDEHLVTQAHTVFAQGLAAFVNSAFPGLLTSGAKPPPTACDPASAFANPCFNPSGSAFVCCPFACGPGGPTGPTCQGFVGDTPLLTLTAASPAPSTTPGPTSSTTPVPTSSSTPGPTASTPGPTSSTPGPTSSTPGPTSTPGASTEPNVAGICDPNSAFPNQCFASNGASSVCCPGACPSSPGPVAACGN